MVVRDTEGPGRYSVQSFICGGCIGEGLPFAIDRHGDRQLVQFFIRQLRHDLPQTVLELLLIDYFVIPRLPLCAGVDAYIRFAYIADFAFEGQR